MTYLFFAESKASTIGELLGGAGSAIAFIWLVVSTRQQAKLIKLQESNIDIQRNELQVQREALAAQRLELNRIGTHGAIKLGYEALREFEDTLRSNAAPAPQRCADLENFLLTIFDETYPLIVNGNKTSDVFDSWIRWKKAYTPAQELVSTFALAIDAYEDASGRRFLPISADPIERVKNAPSSIFHIPLLRQYASTAVSLARLLNLIEPGADRMALAGWRSVAELFGGKALKDGVLDELQSKVAAHDAAGRDMTY
jgi:hypothetical protein